MLLDGLNSNERLLLNIPAFALLFSGRTVVGKAIVMIHACHIRADSGLSRSGFTTGPDSGQGLGFYLDNLRGVRLGGLSSLALSK